MNRKEAIDKAVKDIEDQELEAQKYEQILNRDAWAILRIDRNINYHEEKIKDLEKTKQDKIKLFNDKLELAVLSKWELDNGYTIKPDNRYNIEVEDTEAFLKWLKSNCKPEEVLEFFKDALKKSNLKRFAEKKINEQRLEGVMNPEIDGLYIKDLAYRRLTTTYKKGM